MRNRQQKASKGGSSESVRKQLLAENPSEGMNVDAVAAAQVHKAIAGDTAAFVAIRDTVDRKPQSSESNRGPPSIAINIVSADKVAIAINE